MSYELIPEELSFYETALRKHESKAENFGCDPDQMLHMLRYSLWCCRGLSSHDTVRASLDRLASLFNVSVADLRTRVAQKLTDERSSFNSLKSERQKTWILVNAAGEFYASEYCEQYRLYTETKAAGKTKRKSNDFLRASKKSAESKDFDALDEQEQLAYMTSLKGLTPVAPGTLNKNFGFSRSVLNAMMKELKKDHSWCDSFAAPALTTSSKAVGEAVIDARLKLGRVIIDLEPTVQLAVSILQQGEGAAVGAVGAALKVLTGRRGVEIFHSYFRWCLVDSSTAQISSLAKKKSGAADTEEFEEFVVEQAAAPFDIKLACDAELVLSAIKRVQIDGAEQVKQRNDSTNAAFRDIMAPLAEAYGTHFKTAMVGHQLRAVYAAYMFHLSGIADDAQCVRYYMCVLGHTNVSSAWSYLVFRHVPASTNNKRKREHSDQERIVLAAVQAMRDDSTLKDALLACFQ
jgi:hypothetical protein